MTYIEAKALALVNAVRAERGGNSYAECTHLRRDYDDGYEALCRAIEQHEAFKQEVSDVVEGYFQPPNYLGKFNDTLGRFIIPKPKPDPLVDAIESVLSGFESRKHAESYAHHIRAKLENSGFEIEIREKGQ
jgi:hypothetical protein